MKQALVVAFALALSGCSLFRRTPTVAPLSENVHAVVGQPYQANGVWRYPRSEYGVDQTGLATIAADRRGLTADGEIFDQTALAAGHPTLQLPAVLRVTNLENGRQIVLRLNDRGPASPARLLVLTKRAATLLDMRADGTRIRLQMEDAETRQLASATTSDTPALEVATAPRVAIASQALPDLAGAAQSSRVRTGRSTTSVSASSTAAAAVPTRMPELVTQGSANPGSLFIDAGAFGRKDYAMILVGRLAPLGARLTTSYNAPRERAYRIRIGPLTTVPEAEAMLDRAIGAGVNDAAIVVE